MEEEDLTDNDFLYEVAETYDGDEYVHLSSQKPRKKDDCTFRIVRADDVEMEDLLSYIESDIESANYHGMMDLPKTIADAITKHSDKQTAKRVLWDLKGKFIP